MADLVHTERHGAVALVRLAHPPVNALSAAVRVALHEAVAAARDDPSASAIVIAGDGRCFSGGADIGEFQRSPDAGLGEGVDLNDLSALFEAGPKPVVAAIHGVAFGGGLEIALGAHARVAAPGALLGLPEVKLGVLPGAGGTQRLPRLIGLEAAASMILSGEPVDAAQALALGLVDAVAPQAEALLAAASAHALSLVGQPLPRVRDRALPAWSDAAAADLAAARAAMPQARTHAHNGDHIVACLRAAVQLPFDEGMAFERGRFLACNASPQAAALQHVFFAQREAAKVAGVPRGTPERPVRRVGVVVGGAAGAGRAAAGRGIATAFLRAGFDVRLLVLDPAQADAAVQLVRAAAADAAGAAAPAAACAGSLRVAHGEADIGACDLVVEAVGGDLPARQAVHARLCAAGRPGAIVASTTVAAELAVLAQSSGRPADVVGLHCVGPAMRALEVRPLADTDPQVLATIMALARRLDKVAVVVRGAGGIHAPMWAAYRAAVEGLLQRGIAPEAIDRALEADGMATGPCRAMGLGLPAGRSGGSGSGDTSGPDGGSGAALPPAMDAAAIAAHCLAPLAEVGAALLRDGVAARASDIDMVWVHGRGYPAERGGPMFAAAAGTTS